MPYQNIDATLSPKDIEAIKAAVDTIAQKMPFLVNLTPKERKAMFKAGPDSISFVQKCLERRPGPSDDFPGQLQHPRIQERCRSLHGPHRHRDRYRFPRLRG